MGRWRRIEAGSVRKFRFPAWSRPVSGFLSSAFLSIPTHNRCVNKNTQSTAERLTVLGQFCKLIPKHGLSKVCAAPDKEGIKIAPGAFSVWSHVVSMVVSSIGINICAPRLTPVGPLVSGDLACEVLRMVV